MEMNVITLSISLCIKEFVEDYRMEYRSWLFLSID